MFNLPLDTWISVDGDRRTVWIRETSDRKLGSIELHEGYSVKDSSGMLIGNFISLSEALDRLIRK